MWYISGGRGEGEGRERGGGPRGERGREREDDDDDDVDDVDVDPLTRSLLGAFRLQALVRPNTPSSVLSALDMAMTEALGVIATSYTAEERKERERGPAIRATAKLFK